MGEKAGLNTIVFGIECGDALKIVGEITTAGFELIQTDERRSWFFKAKRRDFDLRGQGKMAMGAGRECDSP